MTGPSSFVQLIYLFRPSFFWKQESRQSMVHGIVAVRQAGHEQSRKLF